MPVRKVVLDNEIPEVLPCSTDAEKLVIGGLCDRTYFAIEPGSKILYKLQNDPLQMRASVGETKRQYFWASMWNTDGWTSINRVQYWNDIPSALKAAIEAGWIVRQLNSDVFKNIVHQMEIVYG